MSLVTVLRQQVEKIKVHKQVSKLSPTERRLNQMTALIVNKRMDPKVRDRLLRELVTQSQVEKALKDRGVKL